MKKSEDNEQLLRNQNRRMLGFINPCIVPIDQDQWDRLKQEIESIHPVQERSNNAKWAIFGFVGSLLVSLLFYPSSASMNFTIIAASLGLSIGLILAAFAFGASYDKDKEAQKETIARCKNTIRVIEGRLVGDDGPMVPTSLSSFIKEPSSMMDDSDESKIIAKETKDPKELLSELTKMSVAK